jgi:hypothetical protein
MKVGIIAPINYLEYSSPPYLVYAKFITSNKYLNYYRSKLGTATMLLGTSPVLPRENNLEVLSRAIKLLNPNKVILPSKDFSCKNTVNLVEEFLRKFRDFSAECLIGVLQGLDLDTLGKCYTFLKEVCGIIGLPSVLEKIARRDEIIRDLGIKEPTLYIEVFSNPYEEIPPVNSLGIITSYPIRLAQDLRELSEYRLRTPPPLDFHIPKGKLIEELVEGNIKEYVRVVREGVMV